MGFFIVHPAWGVARNFVSIDELPDAGPHVRWCKGTGTRCHLLFNFLGGQSTEIVERLCLVCRRGSLGIVEIYESVGGEITLAYREEGSPPYSLTAPDDLSEWNGELGDL